MKEKNIKKGNKITYPNEIIYESGIKGPVGIALAYIKDSEPHYHNKITEWYLVIKGNAVVYFDGRKIPLKGYDVLEIPPNIIHSVKSLDEVELWVISCPPWRQEDHYKSG